MSDIYNTVKALCDVQTGTVTQCIRVNTIFSANPRNNDMEHLDNLWYDIF